MGAAQDGVEAQGELFHGEGFGEVIVGTELEAGKHILLEGLGGEEHDGYLGIGLTYLFSQGKTVFLGHHDIEHAEVVLLLHECFIACIAVGTEVGGIALGVQILS